MKHLFFVHSPITKLMAYQVIKEKDYDFKDVVFLIDRIKLDTSSKVKEYQFPFRIYPINDLEVSLYFYKNWKNLSQLNHFIQEITESQNFYFYATKAQSNYFYLVINNNKCEGYYFIEEGMAAYNEQYWHNKKKELYLRQLLYNLNFNGKVPSVKHFFDFAHSKYKGCFGLLDDAFKGFPNREILNLPFQKKDNLCNYKEIIVFDAALEFHYLSAEVLEKSIELLFQILVEKGIDKCHFKLHPAQKDISIGIIMSLILKFQSQITFFKIPAEIILEEIAVSSLGSSFYICTSSIGLYAHIAGRKVYSWSSFVQKFIPDYLSKQSLPDSYQNNLTYL